MHPRNEANKMTRAPINFADFISESFSDLPARKVLHFSCLGNRYAT